jgi:hypothetical protein
VYCVYSLVTGVSKWLPKWDFTLLHYGTFAVGGKLTEGRLETGGSPELAVDRHGHKSANPVTIPRKKQKNIPPGIEQVCLMASRNYKVSSTVGVTTTVATPVYAILDTGAGPNLVREDVLSEDLLRYRVAGDTTYQVIGANGVERFDFEACLRVSAFQFTRGSALYRE